jgi:hypothetical protein
MLPALRCRLLRVATRRRAGKGKRFAFEKGFQPIARLFFILSRQIGDP